MAARDVYHEVVCKALDKDGWLITDFHAALGQYLNYEYVLEVRDPERELYLAVPLDAYEGFFVSLFAYPTAQFEDSHL